MYSSAVGFKNGMTTHDGCLDEENLQCSFPRCEGVTFKSIKELKRHARQHDPNSTLWYCGCCQNLGHTFEGKCRKDKVQTHLRNRHEISKSGGKKIINISCPAEGCYTLFTALPCVDIHLKQHHPNHTRDVSNQPTNENSCDCTQRAESRALQKRPPAWANKHRATSPLESLAKRGKFDWGMTPSLEPHPETVGFDTCSESTMSPLATATAISEQSSMWIPDEYAEFFNFSYISPPSSLACSYPPTTYGEMPSYVFPANTYPEIADLYQTSTMAPIAPCTQSALYQTVLANKTPTEVLAVRETKDFQIWALNLRRNQSHLGICNSPITYNPVRETITLTGFSKQKIEQAKEELQRLLADISESWGKNYLLTSHSDIQPRPLRCRASARYPSGAQGANNSEQAKVFPVIPKENRQLVELWFNRLLPKLPKILSLKLGGTYTASLIHRGADATVAQPCIQIESPHIPGHKAQGIIRDALREICEKANCSTINVHFLQGSVKKLVGGEDETDENVADRCSDHGRFNFFRPYSKPGMGASLGLLCSKTIRATLGGYVLIGGKKYMLTSEHFIAYSQEQADIFGDDAGFDTLISPSRRDLHWMENSLQQGIRDIDSEIDRLTSSSYGDRDIPLDTLGGPTINEKLKEKKKCNTILKQMRKPRMEYAIGSVFKRSAEPRISTIPKSIADTCRLENNQCLATYHMDWSLCRLTKDVGENRHKYQTTEDAEADDYVEEKDYTNQPGDTCYQTCSVEVGSQVYYVGAGSNHRKGRVHLPSLVSRNSSQTLDWAIRDPDDQQLAYEDVQGDSGAWVIRQYDNALLGQIHSYAANQILFTPIDIIFEEISKVCGTGVSLPPFPSDPGLMSNTAASTPLCSLLPSPPLRPLRFYNRQPLPTDKIPKLSPLGMITLPESSLVLSSNMSASQSDTIKPLSQVQPDPICDSPSSSFSTSTDSWLSNYSSPESPETPRPLHYASTPKGQGHIKQMPSRSSIEIVDESTLSDVPCLPLDSQDEIQTVRSAPDNHQVNTQFNLHIILSALAATWPAEYQSKNVKARLGSEISRLLLSRDHEESFSIHPLIHHFTRSAQTVESIKNLNTMSRSLIHADKSLPMVKHVN